MKTRIVFIGADLWSAHLADELNARFAETVRCAAIRLGDGFSVVPRAASHLLSDDVVVRVGFPPPRLPEYTAERYMDRQGLRERIKRAALRSGLGRTLRRVVLFSRLGAADRQAFYVDWLQRLTRHLRPCRREFLYWIGTDVLHAIDGVRASRYLARLRQFRSITAAERLTDELTNIGVDAATAAYPPRVSYSPPEITPMPQQMTVLTYVPESRREFYGLPAIITAAEALPEVNFKVMGDDGRGVQAPSNVTFVGFVRDPEPLYNEASVVVRYVEHDGAANSMAEGLRYGRQVIYTYAIPHTIHVPFGDTTGLVEALGVLQQQHASGGIPINQAGRDWVDVEYDVDRRFTNLIHALLA